MVEESGRTSVHSEKKEENLQVHDICLQYVEAVMLKMP